MLRTLASISAIFVTIYPALARSQGLLQPKPRQGYYASGYGGGVVIHSHDRERHKTDTLRGYGYGFRGGQMVNDWLGFGLRLDMSSARNDRIAGGLSGFGIDAQAVVAPSLAFIGGAGFGYWGSLERDKKAKESNMRGTAGAYYSAGMTYDWFVSSGSRSGGMAVTPGVFAKYLPGADHNALGLWVTLGFSLWSGLDAKALVPAATDSTHAP